VEKLVRWWKPPEVPATPDGVDGFEAHLGHDDLARLAHVDIGDLGFGLGPDEGNDALLGDDLAGIGNERRDDLASPGCGPIAVPW
jgi:hypothetical protein